MKIFITNENQTNNTYDTNNKFDPLNPDTNFIVGNIQNKFNNDKSNENYNIEKTNFTNIKVNEILKDNNQNINSEDSKIFGKKNDYDNANSNNNILNYNNNIINNNFNNNKYNNFINSFNNSNSNNNKCSRNLNNNISIRNKDKNLCDNPEYLSNNDKSSKKTNNFRQQNNINNNFLNDRLIGGNVVKNENDICQNILLKVLGPRLRGNN